MGLLVLSREREQSIIVGDDITFTIVDIRGSKVRVGIDAPRELSVHRYEVYQAIKRDRELACNPIEITGCSIAIAKDRAKNVAKQLLTQFPGGYVVKWDGEVIELTGTETVTWTVK